MIALVATTDLVKLSAIEALLRADGIAAEVFDAAAASVYAGVIPRRLMVEDGDAARARRTLRQAGFVGGDHGEWDLLEAASAPPSAA